MKGRFGLATEEAVETHSTHLSPATMKSEEDIKAWMDEIREKLVVALQNGPVMIK
jgi:hypothetical protein